MSQEQKLPQAENITRLLNENPGLSMVRGEFGDITFTQRDRQKPSDILWLINASLKTEPTSHKTGMVLRINRLEDNTLKDRTEIDVFPKNERQGYFIIKGRMINAEEVFRLIRAGIKIFDTYQNCPPQDRHLFLIKDPDDPKTEISIVEDILRQDADYLEFAFDEEPKPEEVVEKIASRKIAQRIGLTSIMDGPLPSQHISVMNRLLSLSLSAQR